MSCLAFDISFEYTLKNSKLYLQFFFQYIDKIFHTQTGISDFSDTVPRIKLHTTDNRFNETSIFFEST